MKEEDPDVILTLETDAWWAAQLGPLEERYPHTVKKPLDNTYGMLLHARLELVEPEVKFLFEEGVPSIHTQVRLPSGRLVYLHALHPKPPFPSEDTDTTERDAELLLVGRLVRNRDAPTIVAGDLNDVAWSYTTDLFQKASGLLNPRNGRGMFNTFHAKYPVFRCPLDHVFHPDHFKLIALKRLPYFGSDHFPVLVHLQYEDGAAAEQEEPVADRKSEEKANRKIEKAERIKAERQAVRCSGHT